MPALHRVFPYLKTATEYEPGGPLFVPPQGGGRLDNPGLYSVLYLSDAAPGAIAEAFGRFPEWNTSILAGSPSLPRSARAIARFRLPDDVPICDLDRPALLAKLGLRPSDVVSRDYVRSRAWARRIYEQGAWSGVRWWSYYDPQWASFGLWAVDRLKVEEVRVLRLEDPDLREAARVIARRIVGPIHKI